MTLRAGSTRSRARGGASTPTQGGEEPCALVHSGKTLSEVASEIAGGACVKPDVQEPRDGLSFVRFLVALGACSWSPWQSLASYAALDMSPKKGAVDVSADYMHRLCNVQVDALKTFEDIMKREPRSSHGSLKRARRHILHSAGPCTRAARLPSPTHL